MTTTARLRARRLLAGTVAGAAVATALAAAPSAPAAAAPPVGDCTPAYPLAELRDDLEAGTPVTLTGLTVVRGTTPVTFTADLVGVLDGGISADVDMVIANVDLPDAGLGPRAQPQGIWQGMSGSPVYAPDGRLVGAISYGMTWGPSPIAGITPYEDMDDHLVPRPTVPVPGAVARRLAAATGVSRADVARGFTRLDPVRSVAGVGARRLGAGPDRRWLSSGLRMAGRATGRAATADTIVAGGNLAAAVSYGDVSMSGVGTATSVCDGRVVGFGHPANLLGSTTMGLQPASAVYIQDDPAGTPFKAANLGAPVGTVTDDRLTGIAGTFGTVPRGYPVSASLSYGSRSRTGTSQVYVPEAMAEIGYYQLGSNRDLVLDGDRIGSTELTWKVTGTDESGRPFTLGLANRYPGDDGLEEAAYQLSDLAWALGSVEDVTVTSISSRGVASADRSTLRIVRLEQRRAGAWVQVSRRNPIRGKVGRTVSLRTVLRGGGRAVTVPVSFKVPRAALRSRLLVGLDSGLSARSGIDASSVAAARRSLAATVRADVVRARLGTRDQLVTSSYEGYEEYERRRAGSYLRTRTSAPLPNVVRGELRVPVRARR